MTDSLKCPNCGAPLDYSGSDPIIRCPYCSTSVVVPDNLRSKPAFSATPHNFTLSGSPDMAGLVQKARRIKEVKDLARSGQTEQAISLYREITDSSRTDAEAAVQALAQGQPIVLTGLSTSTPAQVLDRAAQAAALVGQSANFNQPARIETTASSVGSRAGCLIGCFVAGLALFIVGITVILPIFMSSGGLAALNNLTGLGIPSFSFASQELAFGSKGSGPGLFTDVRAIAVNPATGVIFASDYEGGRVQYFDPTGKFIRQWTVGEGTKNTIITGMSADHSGNIYIASGSNVLRYNSSGKLLDTLSVPDNFINDVAVGADGVLVLGCDNDVIATMSPDGTVLNIIKNAFAGNGGDDELDIHVAVDGTGNIYALGAFNNAVFKFNRQGKFVNRFGSEGDNPGEFTAPYAIAADGQGRVYVSDFKGVQVFDSAGRYLNVFDPGGAIFGLAFDDQGNLYASSNSETIYKFSIQKPSTGQ